jgi:hypothetical protein
MLSDVVITIPTKRVPPLRTLESFEIPQGMEVLVIADPDVYDAHRRWIRKRQLINVLPIRGSHGLVPQVMMCYRAARERDYKYFFRLDDDLVPDTFIMANRSNPSLTRVIQWARQCIDATDTSLAGFCNTSRVDWISTEKRFTRSYALIHGGAQICRALRRLADHRSRSVSTSGSKRLR